MKRNVEIMTPAHHQWDDFCDRLEGPDGCDFREKTPGDARSATWKCNGGRDKTFARQILCQMGFDGDSINLSFKYFEAHGGHCDCEILFNVAK